MTLRLFKPLSVIMTMVAVQKIATDKKNRNTANALRVLQCVIISQNISISNSLHIIYFFKMTCFLAKLLHFDQQFNRNNFTPLCLKFYYFTHIS